jgi:hypothetical protein
VDVTGNVRSCLLFVVCCLLFVVVIVIVVVVVFNYALAAVLVPK